MIYTSFSSCAEAEAYAQERIAEISGHSEDGSTDASRCDCPRGIDNWSGEVPAIFLYDEGWNFVEVVAYWE